MNILLFGGRGLLGQAIHQQFSRAGHDVTIPDRQGRLVHLEWSVSNWCGGHPNGLVINCSAMTDVDKCQAEPGTAERVNSWLPKAMAAGCFSHGVPFIHFSTDQVFGDAVGDRVIHPDGQVAPDPRWPPVNQYGRTKADGEHGVLLYSRSTVIRVQWLYGPGRPTWIDSNVVKNLRSSESIVALEDYYGVLTNTVDVAAGLLQLVEHDRLGGTINLINTGEPVNRYEVALFAAESLGLSGDISANTMDDLRDIWKAPRPKASLLAPTRRVTMPEWRESLQSYLRCQVAV